MSQLKQKWEADILKLLVGKTISAVRYQTPKEAEQFGGWHQLAVIIQLNDGTQLIPMSDDEGNAPGAIATSSVELPIIPRFF